MKSEYIASVTYVKKRNDNKSMIEQMINYRKINDMSIIYVLSLKKID